jgi:hypothetical protein
MKHLAAFMFFGGLAMASDAVPTPLTAQEHDSLVMAAFDYLNARVSMLEALASKKAGNEHVEASNQTQQKFVGLLADLRKAHGASDACGWNFQEKAWNCAK